MWTWVCPTRLFFFNDTATTEIYTLSLHDALPIFAAPANLQTIGVSFLNDAWGGSSALDRNLYVDHLAVNGTTLTPQQGVFQDPWHSASTGSSALYNQGTLSWNASLLGNSSTGSSTGSAAGQSITAANQTAQTDAAHPVTVNLLANAIDPNLGDTLTVTGVDLTGTKGAVVLNSDGTASYTPGSAFANLASGQSATDVFHYTISDGHGSTSTAADTVTISGVGTTAGSGSGSGTPPGSGSGTPPATGSGSGTPSSSGFFVSTTGSDSNDGSFAHPFASLAQAQSAMQHSTVQTTYVEGGDYFLHDTLNLTAADNGESFLAYQGQTATLHGGQSLTGWTQGANGGWTTHCPAGLFDSGANGNLDVGGVLQTAARFPDAVPSDPVHGGWLFATGGSNNSIQFNAGDLPHFSNTAGLHVQVFGQPGWQNYLQPGTTIDYNTNTVQLRCP